MKKFLLSVLCVPLALYGIAQTSLSGSGTEGSPYLITSVADMKEFATNVAEGYTFEGQFVRLDADLIYGPTEEFTQVGKWVNLSSSKSFAGTFDGNNHKISGVTLSGASGMAIFVATTDKATVKNVTVSNSTVTSTNSYGAILVAQNKGMIDNCHIVDCTLSSTNGGYKGMVVGHANSSTISNCSVSGILDTNGNAGGIAGQGSNGFSIINCSSAISITDSNAAQGSGNTAHVGGIIGSAPLGGSISGCSFTGAISGGFNGRVGGIGGTVQADVSDCWVTGYIAGSNSASATGGIVASYNGGNFSNNLFAGTVYNVASASVGGLIGEVPTSAKEAKVENCLVYGVVYASSMLKSDLSELIGKGQDFSKLTISNSFYDKQMSGLGSETRGLNTTQLVTATPLEGFSPEKWVFSSSLYPRLASANDNEIATLFAVPVYIAQGETATEITSDFTLGTYADVEWEIVENEYATLTGNTVKVTTPPVKTDVILKAYLGNSERSLQLTLYPKIFEGDGTEESPFIIASLVDWKKLIDACNQQQMTFEGEYFKITADIDMNGEEVAPVGTSTFAGIIDGQGHSFKNLKFTAASGTIMNKGLFGTIAASGVIKNIVIDATENLSISRNFAPLVYSLHGTVENCVNYASFTCTNGYSSGLVWSVEASGSVVNCANYGDITVSEASTFGNCAGIVQSNKGKIDNCLNAGNITGAFAKASIMGGIAAANTGTISNVVNLGTVTGSANTGGISGTNAGGTITDVLSAGIVVSTTTYASVGAISGSNTVTSHVTNAVFDNQMVIYNSIVPDATGMSTAALTTAASNPFAGKELWTVADGAYPMLKSFADNALVRFLAIPVVLPEGETRMMLTKGFTLPAASVAWSLANTAGAFSIADGAVKLSSPKNPETNTLIATAATYTRRIPIATVGNPFEGEGTEASPYLISTPEQMNTLANLIDISKSGMEGKYFRLTADLDFTGIDYKIISSITDEQFDGVFDGNGKKITNLTISTPDATNAALFGVIGANGEVKNLTIEASSISGKGTTGAFAGTLRGKLTDCVNRATVTGSDTYVGGLVGKAETDNARISGCINYGTVTGSKNYVAGIAGSFQGAAAASEIEMTNCVNHGVVNGAAYVAGIVATGKGAIISGCHNTGDITATGKYVAGILAYSANNIELIDCYNSGAIAGTDDVAGVLDTGNTKVNLTRCYNTGAVSATGTYVAGLVGRSNTASIVQCFNTGDVTTTAATIGTTAAGAAGLVAYGCPAMTDCYNSGNVTAVHKAAGIISYRSSSTGTCTVKNVYNTGVITVTGADESKSGAIAGEMSSKTTFTNVSYDSSLSSLGAVCNDSKEGISSLTSAELVAAQMGECWTSLVNHYPVLTYAKDVPAALVASAAIIFGSADQNFDNVTGPFSVGCAGGLQWDGGDAFSIAADGKVILKNTVVGTTYPLTVSLGDCSRTYRLTVNTTSGVSSVEADNVGVSVDNGRVVINASAYTVYSIAGSVVAYGSGAASLDLMPGIYIVVADGAPVKVCIR